MWTKALKRERILSVMEKERAIRHPQVCNGYYAGLAAVLGRDEMELVHYTSSTVRLASATFFAA